MKRPWAQVPRRRQRSRHDYTREARSRLPLLLPLLLVIFFVELGLGGGVEASGIGGTAIGGYVSDGNYFVQNHGEFVEVDRATWQWSLIHTIVTLASWPFAFAGIAIFSRGGWRWGGGSTMLSESSGRLATVEASGPAYLTSTPQFHVPNTTFPAGSAVLPPSRRRRRDTAGRQPARDPTARHHQHRRAAVLAAAPARIRTGAGIRTPITIFVGIDSQEGCCNPPFFAARSNHGAAFVTAAHTADASQICWKSSDGRDSSARVG